VKPSWFSRRLAIWLVLAAGGVFVGLLASGVLSRKTGGTGAAVVTVPPTVALPSEPGGQQRAPATPFGPGDWGTYGGTFDQVRHSPLTQIGKQNLNELGRVFTVDFRRIDPAIPKGQQSFPIVVNGIVYVTTSNDYVFAVDGASGKVIWHWKPSDTGIFENFGVTANRGVAYCDGKVFVLTLDMKLVSLDARTGQLVKEVAISDAVPGARIEFGYSETQAPVCYRDIVLLGASGSDFGVRGFVMAYRTDLTPAWANPYWIIPPQGEGWRSSGRFVGGGTNWNPVTIDPETNTVFATTSNPSPIFFPQARPGPNARTDSIVALDLWTGRQKWWQQQIAGDQWGYSTTQPVLLYDITIGGARRRVVSVGTKEGVWFMYDARTGASIYSRVKLLNRIEHAQLRPGAQVAVYPSSLGGLNYSPSSFDPGTGYVINNQAETSSVLVQKLNASAVNRHKVLGDVDNGLANGSFGSQQPGWHDFGSVSAVDAARGTLAWKFITPEPGRGGVTTTASGIGFAGGGDGILRAFDTKTGNVLWSFQTGYQIAAGPSIYEVHGKEYVAIAIGGTPTSSYGGTASQLMVFALKGDTAQLPAPPLRPPGPGPGYLNAPPVYLSLSAAPRTIELQVVSSLNAPGGADTLDGTSNGLMTVRVPVGWRVNVTYANHAAGRNDGAAVVALNGSAPQLGTPAFAGAESGAVAPSGVSYLHFTASKEGSYAIASTAPARTAAGEWIRFDVGPSSSVPLLVLKGSRYALTPAGGHG
jgi:PQQ-dependent dehydrogenase (methanol/ethanol family)